ncbi:MAG: hypothetical protein HRT57_08375 [Crocinitomicaceae bacterium]|nr:hypothetical protein [Crocinitomicaceae bacterium]
MRLTLLILGLFFSNSSIGQMQWINTGGSVESEGALGLATDSNGNVITIGSFSENLSIQGTTLNVQGSDDMFLLKTDANGNPVWSTSFGQQGSINPVSVIIVNDFIYVSGDFNGTIAFDNMTIQSTSSSDAFIAKFSSDGTPYIR